MFADPEPPSAPAPGHLPANSEALTQQTSQDGAAPVSAPSSGYLRLRGLPFAAGEPEIRSFFGQFGLLQVFICKRNGRSNGEAFVQLADASQTEAALAQLNRQHMGPRYIELFEALEGDLATARALTIDRLRGYVVRMRGLPYNASAADVLRFLEGIEVVRGMEGVIFTWTPDGRPTGEAFVELKDEQAQCEAMKRHKELMGTRYIEMFTSTKAALVQAIQHNRLILGFSNRKRWLQQAGLSGQMVMQPPAGMYPVMGPQVARVDDLADGFAEMNMGGGLGLRGGPMGPQMRGGGGHMQHMGPQQGGLIIQQGGMPPGGRAMQQQGRQDMRPNIAFGAPGMQQQHGGPPRGPPGPVFATRGPDMGHRGPRMPNNKLPPPPQQQQQSYMTNQQQQQNYAMQAQQQHQQQQHQQQQHQQQQQQYGGLQQMGGQSVVVQQQPYIIQQGGGQYVTIESGGQYGLSGQAQDQMNRQQQQQPQQQQQQQQQPVSGQYMVGPSQSYTLQTIQLPSGSNIQDYLQLTSGGNQELQGGGGATYVTGNLQAINMQGLTPQDGSQQGGGMHMLHQ